MEKRMKTFDIFSCEKGRFSQMSDSLLEWYRIRDLFLGRNEVAQDVGAALELARNCKHPDA